MSLSTYILKHVLVNIFDPFDISYIIYIYIYIYIYIHTHALCALKSRTEPIDSRNALCSPELNQLTREMRSEAPN